MYDFHVIIILRTLYRYVIDVIDLKRSNVAMPSKHTSRIPRAAV